MFSTNLYRAEAMAAQTGRLEGDILLARSWSSWLVFGIVLTLIAITVLFISFASYTKRTNATGMLVPNGGAIIIATPAPGLISAVHVEEGQTVHAGDTLFTLRDERHLSSFTNRSDASGARYADQLEAALRAEEEANLREKRQLSALQDKNNSALSRQLAAIHVSIADAKQQITQHQERLLLAEQRLNKHRGLAASGFIAKDKLDEELDNLTLLRAQASDLKRDYDELDRKKLELEDEKRIAPEKTQISIANIDQDLSILRQKIQETHIQSQLAIVAPIDGIVTGISVHPGQISDKDALATLLGDDAELTAQLYVTTRGIGFVEPGQKVRLRYQAYPYQKFGQYSGTVATVSKNPVSSKTLPNLFANSPPDDYYRVTVKLDSQFASVYGEPKRMVSGMIVEADIEQDTRRLIEWMIEPLYGLTKYN